MAEAAGSSEPAKALVAAPSSPARSSGKRSLSPSGGEVIPLPKPKKSGNRLVDEDALSVHSCFSEMVHWLHANRSHIMPLYLQWQRRVKTAQEEAKNAATGGEVFEKPVHTLRSLDEGWLLAWLVSRTKLCPDDIIAAKKQDPESIMQLANYELQISPFMRMPESLRVKEVMFRVLSKRGDECGKRLAAVDKDKFLLSSGQVNWACGAYRLVFKGDQLELVQHCSGAVADVTSEHYSKEWKLENNWDDMGAQLKKGKFAGIKLHLFFDEKVKQGPYAVSSFSTKSKAWAQFVEAEAKEWALQAGALQLGAGKNAMVKEQLLAMKQEQKQGSLEKAREKAKALLEQRKKQRVVNH